LPRITSATTWPTWLFMSVTPAMFEAVLSIPNLVMPDRLQLPRRLDGVVRPPGQPALHDPPCSAATSSRSEPSTARAVAVATARLAGWTAGSLP
jgi:hypothetical protein